MKLQLVRLCAAISLTLGLAQSAFVFGVQADPPLFFIPQPNGVQEVLQAINTARSSFHMAMYRISDKQVIQALIEAHKRGVDVGVILDAAGVNREKPGGAFEVLSAAGVPVFKSSLGFTLSHEKSFVVDKKTAYIMTINLTSITKSSRGVGYITTESEIVNFFEELFAMDVENAKKGTALSPNKIPAKMVVSPVNARQRLVDFIRSARTSIKLEVENFSDTTMMDELIAAQRKGVRVEVMMPRCDLTANDFDMPAAKKLDAGGVNVRMMGAPMSVELPYIHQKSIVVDGTRLFIGSENFTFNSLDKAREIGIIADDMPRAKQLASVFDKDFAVAMNMSAANGYACPPSPFNEDDEEMFQ